MRSAMIWFGSVLALFAGAAFASDSRHPPTVTKIEYRDAGCKHCSRDRIGWFVAGVVAGVVLYESGAADKVKQRFMLKPTAEGATFVYQRDL